MSDRSPAKSGQHSSTTSPRRATTAARRSTVASVGVAVLSLLAAAVAVTTGGSPSAARAAAPASLGRVSHEGRWLTDSDGRALMPQGVNLVAKGPGVTPADMGFDADDAAFLADNGFDVVRLGTTAASIMPEPGIIDTGYLDSFETTVNQLTDAGLLVLIDLHQDGWGPTLGSDGFPDWMTITHGAEDTGTEFPLYYVTNPAIQAAFDSFWANEVGPGGVPLQDRVAAMFSEMASRFASNPGVMGYDLLNEPWPGTVWEPCVNDPAGCPTQDAALDAYHARMTTAIRAEDPTSMIFGEPYVLFNFGSAPTNVTAPGDDPMSGLSYHLYTTDPALDPAVVQYAEQWSERTGGALVNTEFGATSDVEAITRQVDLFDATLTPWMWWAYNENFVRNAQQPPEGDNLVTPVVNALVRPHPRAVNGTPTDLAFDASERVLRFSFDTAPVGADPLAAGLATEIQVAARTYPAGYRTKVVGGTVTSEADAPLLTVLADDASTEVFVKVWSADQPEPPDQPETPNPETPEPGTPGPESPDPGNEDGQSGGGAGATPATPVRGRPSFTG